VDFIGKSIEEMLTAARRIRQQGEINIPFVVTASVYGEDMEGKNVQINENDWVTYLEDGQQLLSLLERLVKTNPLEIN
jgi:ribosomal protein L25 (general stress protein Ctc)